MIDLLGHTDPCDYFERLAEYVDTNSDETESLVLARAMLLVLPIVRAAEKYTDTARELQVFAKRGVSSLTIASEHDRAHRAIQDAIGTLRAALAEGE